MHNILFLGHFGLCHGDMLIYVNCSVFFNIPQEYSSMLILIRKKYSSYYQLLNMHERVFFGHFRCCHGDMLIHENCFVLQHNTGIFINVDPDKKKVFMLHCAVITSCSICMGESFLGHLRCCHGDMLIHENCFVLQHNTGIFINVDPDKKKSIHVALCCYYQLLNLHERVFFGHFRCCHGDMLIHV